MRFGTKITGLLVAVAVVPVAATGIISSALSARAVSAEGLRLQRELARQVAAQVDAWVVAAGRDVERAASYLPFARLQGEQLAALLRVPFRQLEQTTAMLLLDAGGAPVVPPVFLGEAQGELPADVRARPRLSAADRARLLEHAAPFARGAAREPLCGRVYRNEHDAPRVLCGVAVSGPGDRRWVLAAELSLARLEQLLVTASRFGGRVTLAEAGAVILSSHAAAASARAPRAATSAGARYRDASGAEVLGTLAQAPNAGWQVVLEQPLAAARDSARRLLRYTVIWTLLCLGLALAGGFALGRGVTRPVQRLAAAARQIELGALDQRVDESGRDELAQLGRAFNAMAAAVERSIDVIRTQRDELKGWNEHLQQRVEERTREVHEALEQVIRSQKMGALGELSAGVAHELNNPLAAIVLASQLLQINLPAGDERRATLETIIEQSQRMHSIIQNLLRFAETPQSAVRKPVAVGELCREALALTASACEQAHIKFVLDLPPQQIWVTGDAVELQQVLLHLAYNAQRAMPDGGTLTITAREVKEAVHITVADTGRGIAAEKLERIFEPFFAVEKPRTRGAGLGLSVVDRIVREHEGRITVRSTVGQGTEFDIYLPGLRKDRHLTR